MNIIKVKSYQDMSKKAAEFIIEKVRRTPSITLGLATGGTPVGMYSQLIEDHKENLTSYKDVSTFNLDEYIGLSGDNPNSYRYYMNDQLFNHIDVQKSKTNIPRGEVEDLQKECADYENLITENGGVDLQILGIGSNGHIGFNEPGTSFDSQTHIIDLAPSTREENARFFDRLEEVPSQAITMGIETIMKSKEILLLISGEQKRKALFQLLNGEISESFPASVLRKHPCVTIIADEEAIGNTNI
ncbi:glucosamine-6-phosphate deaminase [Bacillus sp. FJAT-29790]|uniref:glucosamine-6-phosphate deaminase n=1 Tax=Bacillus sp. FJAT-29790 TaxID=1895002 RepID=UPI001C224018|nr:glucosamine-6-phosphate deaminase [Bacillus sp. FJAT-29790]MBU8880359.1 glucosamine-6-phosphate deaminase [Bacillus sp. FJAT-29790]